jgi:hypothetical protein
MGLSFTNLLFGNLEQPGARRTTMGQYFFGNRMSIYDCFALSAISFNYGMGNITGMEAFGVSMVSAVLSTVVARFFAK